ncbi:hypothetical protein [Tumidithrix helvetica]
MRSSDNIKDNGDAIALGIGNNVVITKSLVNSCIDSSTKAKHGYRE